MMRGPLLAVLVGVLGLICLVLEFFLPGGALAVLGGCLLTGSTVLFFLQSGSLPWTLVYFLGLALTAGVCCSLAFRLIRKSGKKNSFFLQSTQEGFIAGQLDENLVGRKGVVATELKPTGHVEIEGKRYQAASKGEYLPKGTLIEVVALRGSHVVVISGK